MEFLLQKIVVSSTKSALYWYFNSDRLEFRQNSSPKVKSFKNISDIYAHKEIIFINLILAPCYDTIYCYIR